jgi:hypothetical protein
VRLRRAKIAAHYRRIASLDDDLASIRRNEAKGCAHAGAHSTREACGGYAALSPQRAKALLAGFAKDACGVSLGWLASRSADAPQFGIESIISHCNGPRGLLMAR